MKRKTNGRDLVLLLITTTITIIVWIGFEVYRAYTKANVPTGIEEYLSPLNPKLDTEVINILKTR